MKNRNLRQYKNKEELKQRLKNNAFIRLLLPAEKYIHLNVVRPITTKAYCFRRSLRVKLIDSGAVKKNGNEEALEALKNSHKGETAFIIGNGPSLHAEDLDLLKEYNAYSFACNRIALIFDETDWRPTCYAAIDRKLLFSESFVKDMIDDGICEYYFFWSKFYDCMPEELKKKNVISIEQKPTNPYKVETEFSVEPRKYLISGYTVTNLSVQMAVYMGFTTLCFMGIDCRYANEMDSKGNIKHYEDVNTYFKVKDEKTNQNSAFVSGMMQAYVNAENYAGKHGIKIYNCSKESCLELFEKKDLKTVLNEIKTEKNS